MSFYSFMRESASSLIAAAQSIRSKFPGKELWITEWNFRPAKSPEFNTLAHAIYDIEMLRAFLAAKVDMTCHQIIAGIGFGILGPDRKVFRYDSSTKLLRRVPYFAFLFFSKAQEGDLYFFGSIGDLEYVGFRNKRTAHVVLWSVLPTTVAIKLEIPGYVSTFSGGYILNGDLMQDNGHLLRWKELKGTGWEEEVRPKAVQKPLFAGPGIVILDFELRLDNQKN
jgi:hypothetical protein